VGTKGVTEDVVGMRLVTIALQQKRKTLEIAVHNRCMIDPRLITLRVFARCGTVGATAELTGFSPSAVSAQLRELQRVLGMQLLTKDGRGVRLTATGRFLVAGSDALIAQWESLRAAALEAGDQVQSSFGLGGFSTAAAQLLAPLAATLRSTRPLLKVQLLEAEPARCFDLLVAERIDLAVVVAMQSDAHSDAHVEDDPRFDQTVLLDDPLDVIIPSDHPLASRETVTLDELASEPWITEAAGSTYHSLFTAAFTAVGATPRVAHEAVEWETLIAFVGAGLGVGLLPRLAPLHGAENVVRMRITGRGKPSRRIVAAVRRGSIASPLIQESLDILQVRADRILTARPDDDH
jgi:DNA-binding transcriptional LysR family regulator